MCYFITLASPLTLSEVRSMLVPGLSAQPMSGADGAAMRSLHPPAQTVAMLLVGGCSCDLVRPREPDARDDERHLRARYGRLGLTRARIINELERHRRRPAASEPGTGWPGAFLGFIAEHARNAGPTLYLLRFGAAGDLRASSDVRAVTRTLSEVRAGLASWLEEDRPALVVR